MIKNSICVFVCFISIISFGQNPNRKYRSVIENKNGIEVNVSDGKYIIQFYTSKIVETTFLPQGEVFNPNSHAVVLMPEHIDVDMYETSESIKIFTDGIDMSDSKAAIPNILFVQE